MQIIRSSDAIEKNAHSCTAFEYPVEDKDVNVARIWINGNYPLKGVAVNHEVKELVYVEEGQGTVTIDDEESSINAGDVIVVEKGESVCWEGELTLIVFCAPPWRREQYEILPAPVEN